MWKRLDRARRAVLRATQTRVSKYEAIRRPQLHRARPNERGIDRGSQWRKKMYFRYSNPRRAILFVSQPRFAADVDGAGEQIRAV